MNTIDFRKTLNPYYIFSLQEIRKIYPDFSYRQIDRWEKNGYLLKIKQGFYTLADQETNQNFSFLVANKIYSPSYISLEKALKFYGLIPDEVFQITSVSTKKTTEFETPVGNFSYRHISPRLFWGYRLVKFDTYKFLIADPEKAILDYLYLHAKLKTEDDFTEMRINKDSFRECVNIETFHKYLEVFDIQALTKRANAFLNTLSHD